MRESDIEWLTLFTRSLHDIYEDTKIEDKKVVLKGRSFFEYL